MDGHEQQEHHVKRIVLPSGKTIEVVYFSDAAAAAAMPAPLDEAEQATDAPAGGLHICPGCDSQFVHPTEWAEAGKERWRVALRCPNCEWHGSGVFSQELVDWFDDQLDHGTDALVRDLKRLTRANMENEIDRFCAALRADAILPEDF